MKTSTRPSFRPSSPAFTLVEVMIGSTLSTFILAGVLSTFLFLGRSGVNLQNYSDMESQARGCLETFAEDVRQASAISWTSSTSITLTLSTGTVTYDYVAGNATTEATFVRNLASSNPRVLLTGITDFTFKAYTITGVEITDFSSASARTTAGNTTKQLQLSVSTSRDKSTLLHRKNATNSSSTVLSARFILRNKHVTA